MEFVLPLVAFLAAVALKGVPRSPPKVRDIFRRQDDLQMQTPDSQSWNLKSENGTKRNRKFLYIYIYTIIFRFHGKSWGGYQWQENSLTCIIWPSHLCIATVDLHFWNLIVLLWNLVIVGGNFLKWPFQKGERWNAAHAVFPFCTQVLYFNERMAATKAPWSSNTF